MYQIKCLYFDVNGSSEEIIFNKKFFRYITALNYALNYANAECQELNNGCNPCVFFGVVIDEDRNGNVNTIRVQYYYNPPDDTTGNTGQVINIWIEKVKRKGC